MRCSLGAHSKSRGSLRAKARLGFARRLGPLEDESVSVLLLYHGSLRRRSPEITALALVALYASEGSPRFDKAAVRWLARYALERDDVRLVDLQMAAAALAALPEHPARVLKVLQELSD